MRCVKLLVLSSLLNTEANRNRCKGALMIQPDKVQEYLDTHSDFNFEMLTANVLTELEVKFRHGWMYLDRQYNKMRQYDFCADICFGTTHFIRLAIECKNINSEYPVIIE